MNSPKTNQNVEIDALVHKLAVLPDLAIREYLGLDVGHGNHRLAEPVKEGALLQVLQHEPTSARISVQGLVGSHDPLPTCNVPIVLRVELVLAVTVHDNWGGA